MRATKNEKVEVRLSVPIVRSTFTKIQELSSLWHTPKAEIARNAIEEFICNVEKKEQEALMARAYEEWAGEGTRSLEDFKHVDSENWD